MVEPLEGVLVEVFDKPDVRLKVPFDPTNKEQKRLVVCKTGEDGKFCFEGIPKGTYEVRLSKELFEVSSVIVTLDPDQPQSLDQQLKVHLQPGI